MVIQNDKIKPVWGVLSLVGRGQWLLFALMIFVLCISAFVTLGFGVLLKGLVDQGFSNNDVGHLDRTLAVMLGMVALLAVASFARISISGWLSEQIVSKLRFQAFSHLLGLDPAFYSHRQSGEIASALSADFSVISTVVATSLPMMVRHSIMAIGGFVMLVATSPHLTLLVLAVLPLAGLPVILIGRVVRARSKAVQEHAGHMGGMIAETLGAIQTVQSYTAEASFLNEFTVRAHRAAQAAMQQVYSRAAMVSSIIFILFVALCVVMWIGAHEVIDGQMSAGALTSFVFYAGVLASALGVLGDMGAALFKASAALVRVQDILGVPSLIASPVDAPQVKAIKGHIDIENLSFQYPVKGVEAVLNGLDFSVKAGETVAIVGASGAGKTTVFQLLMRFYDPAAGRIMLDGQDIKFMNLQDLRRNIAYVPQDSTLFSSTVRDNILLGNPQATEAQIEQAARDAMAHAFIMSLPQGYDTPLGERGHTLSGGQKQRIALARALLKNAPVLLLDEATSALDSGHEQSIQNAVQNLHGKQTVMIIAHRLSTVMHADRIYVMDRGKIVEHGTHTTLLAKNGVYARMVSQQFSVLEDHARRAYPDLSGSIQ